MTKLDGTSMITVSDLKELTRVGKGSTHSEELLQRTVSVLTDARQMHEQVKLPQTKEIVKKLEERVKRIERTLKNRKKEE